MLVRERTESVGTEVDEGFHVLFCEPSGSNFALVVHCVVVVFIVCPARLADGFIGHLFSVLAIFLILRLSRFAGFGLALGHGALLAGLPGAFAGSLAALHEALLVLLPQALLAWVLLLLALLLSITILVLLAILILTLALLIVTLALVLLIVTLALVLLIVALVLTLLAVLLLLTVLRHSFGKLRLKDQVTSQRIS